MQTLAECVLFLLTNFHNRHRFSSHTQASPAGPQSHAQTNMCICLTMGLVSFQWFFAHRVCKLPWAWSHMMNNKLMSWLVYKFFEHANLHVTTINELLKRYQSLFQVGTRESLGMRRDLPHAPADCILCLPMALPSLTANYKLQLHIVMCPNLAMYTKHFPKLHVFLGLQNIEFHF